MEIRTITTSDSQLVLVLIAAPFWLYLVNCLVLAWSNLEFNSESKLYQQWLVRRIQIPEAELIPITSLRGYVFFDS